MAFRSVNPATEEPLEEYETLSPGQIDDAIDGWIVRSRNGVDTNGRERTIVHRSGR